MSFVSNPYSTRFVTPGAIEFLFPEDDSAAQALNRLRTHAWWGQIVGPHGSGKSTLVLAMLTHLEEAGREVELVRMGSHSRRLPLSRSQAKMWSESTQVIIDGFEQLSWPSKTWVKRACRSSRAGLLVTTHGDAKLPTIFATQPSLPLAKRIVMKLNANVSARDIEHVDFLFAKHDGNIREILFELYDRWERERREARTDTPRDP